MKKSHIQMKKSHTQIVKKVTFIAKIHCTFKFECDFFFFKFECDIFNLNGTFFYLNLIFLSESKKV